MTDARDRSRRRAITSGPTEETTGLATKQSRRHPRRAVSLAAQMNSAAESVRAWQGRSNLEHVRVTGRDVRCRTAIS